MSPRLGYLSGAPRVSTRPDAETSGARSHILGMSGAFEQLGWEVDRFIVGDRLPPSWSTSGSQRAAGKSFARRLAADVVRITLGQVNARRARRELRGRVDLVYERFGAFQALGSAVRGAGVPWILETNGPLSYEAKVERKSLVLGGLARRMERVAYHQCDLLVCISEPLKEILVTSFGVPADKVVVIPNGVDTEFFDPASYEPARLFPGFTVGFVGNLYAWAGLDLLFDAVAELRHTGLEISVVVVGDGMMRQSWDSRARSLGLADCVGFTGRLPRPTVPRFIAGCDVGYSGQTAMRLGSMYHSPLKIYEYMAMARAPVASAFSDAVRVITDGVNGFLFTPGDKESLKLALRRAYAARSALGTMGAAARAEIVAHHGWTARVRTLLEAIERRQSGSHASLAEMAVS